MEWIIKNAAVLVSAAIGVIGALLGVIITQIVDNKRRRKELIDKAKPIVINHAISQINKKDVMYYHFSAEGQRIDNVTGVFKNTDNGILFLDYINTGARTYTPEQNATVDKNTEFCLVIDMVNGETLDKCEIMCHDIFGTKYRYTAHYDFIGHVESQIVIENSMPEQIK